MLLCQKENRSSYHNFKSRKNGQFPAVIPPFSLSSYKNSICSSSLDTPSIYPFQKNISGQMKIVPETPQMFWSDDIQTMITEDIKTPRKKWIHHIINKEKEQEFVKLDTDDFVLLPDTQRIYRKSTKVHFNWLAIMKNTSLRNIRDLTSDHIPLLQNLKKTCIERILTEYPHVKENDIMIFANYPPSVHVLHFHFCFPFLFPSAYDAFRIHSIDTIINNLIIHPNYYSISTLLLPLHESSPWFSLYHCQQDKNKRNTKQNKLLSLSNADTDPIRLLSPSNILSGKDNNTIIPSDPR